MDFPACRVPRNVFKKLFLPGFHLQRSGRFPGEVEMIWIDAHVFRVRNWVEKPSTLVEIGLIVWPARSSHSMFVFIGFGRPWSKWCTLILSLSGCVAFLSCIACTTSIVGFLQESGFLSGPGQRLWWRVCHRCQEIVTWWEEKWKVIKTNEGLCVDYRDLTRLPHTVDDDM